MALTLLNRGLLLYYQGRYVEAVEVFRRSHALLSREFGNEHPALPVILHNLANTYMIQEEYAEAESVYRETIESKKQLYDPDHPEIAITLSHLAEIHRLRGEFAKADSLFETATGILEREGGYYLGTCLTSFGNSLYDQGRYSEAEQLYVQALSIWENTLTAENPLIAEGLGNLARCSCALGNYTQALRYFERRHRTRQQFIESVFSYASEDQKLRYIRTYPVVDQWLLSFALLDPSEESTRAALDMVISAKALVVDALAAERAAAYCSSDSSLLDITARHRDLSGEIATLTLEGTGMYEPDVYRERLKVLHAERDSLEVELSHRCLHFRDDIAGRDFSSSDLMEGMPDDGVYVEYVMCEPYDFTRTGTDEARHGSSRYLAFTLDREGTVILHDLGDAGTIDSLILTARYMISKAKQAAPSPHLASLEKDLAAVTGNLYGLVIGPLEAEIGGKRNVYVCPDGQTNLLPLEILPCSGETYMIERYFISYLSSGRDWLRFQEDQSDEKTAIVLADPDFSYETGSSGRYGSDSITRGVPGTESAAPTREASSCFERKFTPLPGTQREAETISEMLTELGGFRPDVYTGRRALEEVVKTVDSSPRILHLSTHGFFCEDVDSDEQYLPENPLLRSGVVLAGANHAFEDRREENGVREDGILTAFEASGLNLAGTELVILSACETGMGEVVNGEGVYGLRRSFHYAGAEAVIMSLWKIPDVETSQIMMEFYERWLSGDSKKEALRHSALAVLRKYRERYGFSHPIFWGGFILAGDPR